MKRRLVVGLVLIAMLALVAVQAMSSMQRELAATNVCRAAAERRWSDALASEHALDGHDEAARSAVECRCLALLMTGETPRCVEELEQAVGDEEWAPDPLLTRLLAAHRLARGDQQRALALVERAWRAYPDDVTLLPVVLDAKAAASSPAAALDAVASQAGPEPSLVRRVALAEWAMEHGLPDRALVLLGRDPPAVGVEDHDMWFFVRAMSLGALNRRLELRSLLDAWREHGAPEGELLAYEALVRGVNMLVDEQPPIEELLERALARKHEVRDPDLLKFIYARLITQRALDAAGRERALALLPEAKALFPDLAIEERDILSSDQNELQLGVDGVAPRGKLAFQAPVDVGGVLKLAPELDEPVDAPFRVLPLPAGQTRTVERVVGRWPVRWVFVDDDGAVRASGNIWPVEGRAITVRIEARAPSLPSTFTPAQAAADGRRRAFVVILDSADWRLVTYLMARGDLPVLSSIYEKGLRAVLDSVPAFTAAAMKALTQPDAPRVATVPIALHGIGEQLTTFFHLGENPLDTLSLIVPRKPDLFGVLGSGDVVVGNMLNGHGGLNAGVHGGRHGPRGMQGPPLELSPPRSLTPDDVERFRGLTALPPGSFLHDEVKDTAALFDDAVGLARGGEIDLLLLRIPATDHAAHSTFGTAARGGQDDGDHFLYWLYRYCDARLGEIYDALDADDVLVVISDHGISSHMAHDRRSMFLVGGASVPSGRAKTIIPFRGLPRMFADLLGVASTWEKSGVEGWVTHLGQAE